MRHRLMGLSGLQVGLTTLCIAAAGLALGLNRQIALTVGAALALSSTAIVMQTLTEKGLMTMPGGRSTFATLLTQHIAVIPMLALIPLLASLPHSGDGAAHDNLSLVDGLPGWQVTLVTLGAVAVIILAGTHLINPIFRHIHSASLREMNTALALLIVVGIAVLLGVVGLSAALGSFLAGVVLANSAFRHQLESDLQPFKGLLSGLLFITVTAGIDFGTLWSEPLHFAVLTLGLIVIKGACCTCWPGCSACRGATGGCSR